MARANDSWADGKLAARLRELWMEKDGRGNTAHSTSYIGRALGVTKNATVGKAHRLGLPSRPSPIKPNGKAYRPPPPRKAPPKDTLPSLAGNTAFPQATVHVPTRSRAPVVVKRKPKATPKPIAESTPATAPIRPYSRIIECCWPIGEPGSKAFRYCSAESEPGKVYCQDHCRIGFRSLRDLHEDSAA
jgi:GcrA cell cycle regulator